MYLVLLETEKIIPVLNDKLLSYQTVNCVHFVLMIKVGSNIFT